MNNYQNLNYQHVSFKGSHNSYQQPASMSVQLTFDPQNPSNYGCRGLELDIWRNSDKMGIKGSATVDIFKRKLKTALLGAGLL